MSLSRSVSEILDEHTTLELECIDRMYLNLYVPILQKEAGCAYFWTKHRGHRMASSVQIGPMSHAFVRSIERFAEQEGIEVVRFRKGQRKEEVAQEFLRRFEGKEGVLFIGKAQEKASVVWTETRRNPETGATYPWLVRSTAMVNHYYFYCVDRDFGPFFLKFCSYFPYNGKLLLNGHEYAKRQLTQRGIPYEALDNGILTCADPTRLQRLADGLTDKKIDALARKWFGRLPHPFPAADRRAGFRYDISILQAEFSLTQVLDRPLSGRRFFEQVIRENLDLGRPSQVQLIFDRRVIRTTPGRFRTRVITEGVIPSLHVDYKHSKIKQYHKEGHALRTETIINDAYDFEIGRKLKNLSALRKVGFQANRRLLSVQRISHDAFLGEDAFAGVQQPALVEGQRASGLRFGDPRVLALLACLLLFRLLPRGFSNRDLREHMASFLSLDPGGFTQNQMTYDLRRLRLHGFIQRIPKSHRYQVTDFGYRSALFLTQAYNRLLCPGTAVTHDPAPPVQSKLGRALGRVDREVERIWQQHRIAA
jgi:hypothetical protein